MALIQGANSLVGSSDFYVPSLPADNMTEGEAVPSMFAMNNGTDGTEYLVGAIVLGALLLLILFRVGGFKAVIAEVT